MMNKRIGLEYKDLITLDKVNQATLAVKIIIGKEDLPKFKDYDF
jgi:hypothetical protein